VLFSLEAVEIVVFAYVLVFLCDLRPICQLLRAASYSRRPLREIDSNPVIASFQTAGLIVRL
jgi:hypothetical protein